MKNAQLCCVVRAAVNSSHNATELSVFHAVIKQSHHSPELLFILPEAYKVSLGDSEHLTIDICHSHCSTNQTVHTAFADTEKFI